MQLTDAQQRAAARKFSLDWMGKGREKSQSQVYWLTLLRDVYGVQRPEEYIRFESEVHIDKAHGFIDGYIPNTKVMIEQKGYGKSLDARIKQSDGTELTPFQQAQRYTINMKYSERPRWIVTCNFAEIWVYDMEKPDNPPEKVRLADLERDYYRLSFLIDPKVTVLQHEMDLSVQAGEIVGALYDAFRGQYRNPDSKASMHALNVLCVRLVFCLYAEDAGIFGRKSLFHDYMASFQTSQMRSALLALFKVLDTKKEDREYVAPELDDFPYVNGGLFAGSPLEVPLFTEEIRELLLVRASENFNWARISPTIFGAVFESTLNPETRRAGGMHYTSVENIHKVIDPLFLDGLNRELAEAAGRERGGKYTGSKADPWRRRKLRDFQTRLASLTFMDPACGSGNFLTETYLSIRRLENKVLLELMDEVEGQYAMDGLTDEELGIKVGIGQFYGMEINDFAVSVARTALWIAESQMMQETSVIINRHLTFLPLKTDAHILEGNALRMDWEQIIPARKLSYIMGNPPFVGFTYTDAQQKADMLNLFPKVKNLDYVCGWFRKASDYIQHSDTECGLVATNSIAQGETVARLWPFLNVRINFAHRTFQWDSEASLKAHVHCVIIGFAAHDRPEKVIYQDGVAQKAANINAYLCDAPDILVFSRSKPLSAVPKMVYGNKPADGGNLIIEDADLPAFLAADPKAERFIRPLTGASEYLHGKKRWCLWLDGASPSDIKKCPEVYKRVQRCKEARESSIAAGIRKFADTPALFAQRTQPVGDPYIIIPRVSSERRAYVPMGFNDGSTIVTDAVQIVPEATPYHFGILTSFPHMAWMRTVCGRLKSDYRYSKDVVYNNFPWPDPTPAQKARIEQTAAGIIKARDNHPDCTLADLYDDTLMPPDLRKAHRLNDEAVLDAYGMPRDITEPDCVARLMALYQELAK